jgi:hypothetical protein
MKSVTKSEKKKETDLEAFMHDDNMISGEDVKVLETSLSHWERGSKEYRLEINLENTV